MAKCALPTPISGRQACHDRIYQDQDPFCSRPIGDLVRHSSLRGAVGTHGLLLPGLSFGGLPRLCDQDRTSKVQQLENEEVSALKQAGEMAASNHHDLAVIQAWKALEARLRQALLRRGIVPSTTDAQSLLDAAGRAGILTGKSREQVEDLRRQWNVAVSTEPLTREAAERAPV